MKHYSLSMNEDDSHFYMTREKSEMNEAHFREFVQQYSKTSVDRLIFNVNAMRASFSSQVWERVWDCPLAAADQSGLGVDDYARHWIENGKIIEAQGLDTYAVWLDECRKVGISGWLSMRMNDIHCVNDPDHFLHSSFWRKHPEYWRLPHSEYANNWGERALDYSHEAVRRHHMLLIDELLERYDMQGLELDWMRFGLHFRPGFETQDAHFLTEFMAQVRKKIWLWSKKRGHVIELSARVPVWPDNAWGLGMDGVQWAREGLVDELVITPFFLTTDFDLPIDYWRSLIGEAAGSVRFSGGVECRIMSQIERNKPFRFITAVDARGLAASILHQQGDVYLFNHMDRQHNLNITHANLWEIYRELGNPRDVACKPRRHAVTYVDLVPEGTLRHSILPFTINDGGMASFRLHLGTVPKTGKAYAHIGLAQGAGVPDAVLRARLNTNWLPEGHDLKPVDETFYLGSKRVTAFEIPLNYLHDGYNIADFGLTIGAPQQAVWVDITLEP